MSFREKCVVCAKNLIAVGICAAVIALTLVVGSATRIYAFLMFFTRFLALTVIFYNVLGIMIKLKTAEKLAVALRWVMRVGYVVFAASFIIVLSLILIYAAPDEPDGGTDYIIVLGAGLNGTEPSLILRDRLDKAYETMLKYPDAAVILCGGQGTNEVIAEARAMFDYLSTKGADPERLICEEESTDTDENIKNAGDIIFNREGTRDKTVVIVTCGFHMMRSKLIAEKYGMDPYAATSPTKPREFHYYLREYFSLLIYTVELTGISIDFAAFGLSRI